MLPIEFDFDRYVSLETQISSVIQRSLDRRTSVFVSPTLDISNSRYDGVQFSKKYRDLLTLIILTWYSDYFGDFSEYVRYEIEVYLNQVLLFPELNASLTSKNSLDYVILLFLKHHSSNDFFGNVLSPQQINRVLDLVHLRMVRQRRPKKLVYRRGYKDKGSLRPETTWLPKKDWSFDKEQNRIEDNRQEYQNLVTLIVRASGDWVLRRQVNRKEEESNE